MHLVLKTAGAILLPLVVVNYALAAPVQITVQPPPPVQSQVAGGGAGADLSRNLTLLSDNPDNIVALVGAGRAALELGDSGAALNFFGRAEELSPRDGTIKAGIGSAMALMEQPEAALQFFYEAARLGVPAVEMAAFRGLAYDLTGDPRRAQLDYQLALRRRDDPEVRRRLALSLAISGQRDAALSLIDHQLRRQDRAAWRTRAFILALTGDAQGATRVLQSMMPYQAAAMAPFLARLPSLSLADRARAVHFGHFPADPTSASAAPLAGDPITAAGQPDPGQRPLGQSAAAAPTAPRPPPPAAATISAPPRSAPSPGPLASTPPPPTDSTSGALAAARTAQSPVTAITAGPTQPPAPVVPAVPPSTDPTSGALAAARPVPSPVTVMPPPGSLAPGFSVEPPPAALPPSIASTGAAVDIISKSAAGPGPAQPAPRTSSLAGIAAVLAKLADPPARAPTARLAATEKAGKPASDTGGRIWVQISRSRTESGLASEFRRVRSKAPGPLAGKTAWTAPAGPTNRLLVGPFKSDKEAQNLVSELKKAGHSAFSWTSAAGQEIKKLPAQ